MRRVLPISAVLLCAVLLAPGVGAAKGKSKTYKVTSTVKASDVVFTDVKGDGPSPGDVYTFTLTSSDKNGKQNGFGHGYCVLGTPTFSTCTSVTSDGKGKIVTTWEDDGNANTVEQLAITGGTKRYRYLRGDGTSKQLDATTYRVTLTGTLR